MNKTTGVRRHEFQTDAQDEAIASHGRRCRRGRRGIGVIGQLLEHSVPFCVLLYCTNILSTVVNNYFEQINDDDDDDDTFLPSRLVVKSSQ